MLKGINIKQNESPQESVSTAGHICSDDLATVLGAHDMRRLHRHSWLFILTGLVIQWIFPISIALWSQFHNVQTLWVVVAIGLFIVLGSVLHFLTYRFCIHDGDVVIHYGILFRMTRYVPLHKVHNVTLHRTLLHRWLGVAEVRLESAGNGKRSEALLRVLSLDDARAFERLIEQYHHADERAQESDNLLPLSHMEVLRYGLISNAGLAWGGFLTLLMVMLGVDDWLSNDMPKMVVEGELWHQASFWWLSALVVVATIVLLGKFSTILAAFLGHSHFYLSDSDSHITQRRGLLTKVESHVPREKIQCWRIVQNPFHRWLRRYALHIDTAVTAVKLKNGGSRGIRELVPLADVETMGELLKRWTHTNPLERAINPLHPKADRRIFIRYSLLWLVMLASLAFLWWLFQGEHEGSVIYYWTLFGLWLALLPLNYFAACRRVAFAGWQLERDGWLI
ncbi:PH domain-containing protein [Cardiobacteriaceae bacterium TAE3-ERU3]|nr:PH domain-containing protein [Cardiobacteriaceae bacterium TAE3-ERU3]